jgi:predicted DCC family thiol-disulfide oxidoreductase YuxK
MASAPPFIILFDVVCNLCISSVDFIMKKDRRKRFLFASLQGESGQALLKKFNLPVNNWETFVVIEGDKVYTKSTAALRIVKHLGSAWQLLYGFIIVPKFLRDKIYRWIAGNRYKWFGKRDTCRVATPDEKSRFLD